MGLVSEGIERVRALQIAGGVGSDGSRQNAVRRVLVRWRSSQAGKLHQVYVNGRFAGATVDCEQRRMIVAAPSSFASSVRIEVFAVEASEADTDLGGEISGKAAGDGRVRIRMLRSQGLAADATVDVYSDNGTGTVDYSEPLNDRPVAVWPSAGDKAGFGLGGFGGGDFGYEGSQAAGFGLGGFGSDLFGMDADVFDWVSGQLAAGSYRFGVKVSDSKGRVSAASETDAVFVDPAAEGTERLGVESFERSLNRLRLSVGNA